MRGAFLGQCMGTQISLLVYGGTNVLFMYEGNVFLNNVSGH